jgi:hypothetical protein
VIAGFAYGDADAFVDHVVAIAPRRLLLMDQLNDARRRAGQQTEIVTPARDVLVARGVETHPLVAGISMRFERDDTVKRW